MRRSDAPGIVMSRRAHDGRGRRVAHEEQQQERAQQHLRFSRASPLQLADPAMSLACLVFSVGAGLSDGRGDAGDVHSASDR